MQILPHQDHSSTPFPFILQLHFPSRCWQQGSLDFSPNFSPSFWPVYLLIRDCLISFVDLTVPSSLQERGTSCLNKDVTHYPLPVKIFKTFFLGKKFFLPLVLAYWLLLTLRKSTSHHKKDILLDLFIDLRLGFSISLVFHLLLHHSFLHKV